MDNPKNRRRKRWVIAGSWAGFIYATLYIARPVCEFFKQYSGFSFFVNAGMAVCIAIIVGVLLKKKRIRRVSTYFLLFLVIAGYGLGMIFISIPEERLHFLEYGILAFLIYRALTLDLKNNWAYGGAFVIVSMIGAGDEGIQYLLPNRYYQTQDVILNSASAALGLILVFTVYRD